MSKFINLERLNCIRTNDVDRDECQLEIWLDGRIKNSIKMRLSPGESSWFENRYDQFEKQVEVGLFDEDEQDNEDSLGLINLQTEPVHQTLTVAVDSEKGSYILSYRIELEKPPELLAQPPSSSGGNRTDGGIITPEPEI